MYQGYVLKVVSGYTLGTDDRYAVIWVNAVMSPTDISFIDNKVTTYMWLTEHYGSFPNGIDTPVFGPGALLGTIYGTNKNYSPRIRP